jgi:hypothetical protein
VDPYRAPPGSELLEVAGADEVEALAQAILDPERSGPIVALTSRQGDRAPALDPEDVRAIVGPGQAIHVVADGPLTRRLEELLPPRLHVYGGAARVWWPGVRPNSDPRDHPLVFERHGVYGSRALATLRRRWEEGPPRQPAHLDGEAELVLLRDEVAGLRAVVEARAGELREAEGDREALRGRLRLAEERARRAPDSGPVADAADADAELDPEGRFALSIVRAWAESLDPASRAESPLRPFVVGAEMVPSLAGLPEVSLERAAYVCAMVACGLAVRLAGMQVHPLRSSEGGDTPQVERGRDGARAWRAALRGNMPSAPRLHYWERPDGVLELANAVRHDDFAIAGA